MDIDVYVNTQTEMNRAWTDWYSVFLFRFPNLRSNPI